MHIFPTNKPQIFVSMGDASGVGPEVTMKAIDQMFNDTSAVFVVVGDAGVMKGAAEQYLRADIVAHDLQENETISLDENKVNIIDPGPEIIPPEAGDPKEEGTVKTLKCLAVSVEFMQDPENTSKKALVTAPVNKEQIARVLPGFIGHTEYLCGAYSCEHVTMVLVGEHLCVSPVTRHIPIKDVATSLSEELIVTTISQVVADRVVLTGKKDPMVGVSALNPHCGEGGTIGTEEIDMITPAVEKARLSYPNIEGPISADVLFYKAIKKEIDIVVAMYHDQGLSPFKMVDFEYGVNMTLGLGHIRTSPDHGTAYDIAGKGIADSRSMEQAIKLAIRAIA